MESGPDISPSSSLSSLFLNHFLLPPPPLPFPSPPPVLFRKPIAVISYGDPDEIALLIEARGFPVDFDQHLSPASAPGQIHTVWRDVVKEKVRGVVVDARLAHTPLSTAVAVMDTILDNEHRMSRTSIRVVIVVEEDFYELVQSELCKYNSRRYVGNERRRLRVSVETETRFAVARLLDCDIFHPISRIEQARDAWDFMTRKLARDQSAEAPPIRATPRSGHRVHRTKNERLIKLHRTPTM